jgi:hypothetical protein
MLKSPAHLLISWVFFIGIGMVFGYSYFFYPSNHPISCFMKEKTGETCPSCGISRSFSPYTHLEFKKAMELNKYSFRIFLFFILQFMLRLFFIFLYKFKLKKPTALILKSDVIVSISSFLFAFLPLVINY